MEGKLEACSSTLVKVFDSKKCNCVSLQWGLKNLLDWSSLKIGQKNKTNAIMGKNASVAVNQLRIYNADTVTVTLFRK